MLGLGVEAVADRGEAELAQVVLGEQEDGASVDVVVEEGGYHLPELGLGLGLELALGLALGFRLGLGLGFRLGLG